MTDSHLLWNFVHMILTQPFRRSDGSYFAHYFALFFHRNGTPLVQIDSCSKLISQNTVDHFQINPISAFTFHSKMKFQSCIHCIAIVVILILCIDFLTISTNFMIHDLDLTNDDHTSSSCRVGGV